MSWDNVAMNEYSPQQNTESQGEQGSSSAMNPRGTFSGVVHNRPLLIALFVVALAAIAYGAWYWYDLRYTYHEPPQQELMPAIVVTGVRPASQEDEDAMLLDLQKTSEYMSGSTTAVLIDESGEEVTVSPQDF